MNRFPDIDFNDQWILSRRGKKQRIDPFKPYAFLNEKEHINGVVEDISVIFLSNKECPFRCLMCDLWQYTTDNSVPKGAIPEQIEYALKQLAPTKHLKLYNSGNFFDNNAIPESDYAQIAELLQDFETIIVECHPKLINEKCLRFRDMLKPKLQVGMGLETVHSGVLAKLNKKFTLTDFENSVKFLDKNDIAVRAFILLRPPFLSEKEGIEWAKKSIDFALSIGIKNCTIIPTRSGNGAMDELLAEGLFTPPKIQSLEKVLDYGINLKEGVVFADLWDIELFSSCTKCIDDRKKRLLNINLNQKWDKPIHCICNN